MKTLFNTFGIVFSTIVSLFNPASAQSDHPHLHVNPRWNECSFQIDSSLTPEAWHRFTGEAGMVAYFRPLVDAKPLGRYNFELALLQWNTGIDDASEAWNNTFVHPDSAHWLKEGPRLGVPGLTGRIGITNTLDIGIYWVKNPEANYGIYGAQLQYSLYNKPEHKWNAAARIGFSSLYGPEDIQLNTYGMDLLVSRSFRLWSDQVSVTPYAGVSPTLTSAEATTEKVHLNKERVWGIQSMAGITAKIYWLRLGMEYNQGIVSTISFKAGVGFFNGRK